MTNCSQQLFFVTVVNGCPNILQEGGERDFFVKQLANLKKGGKKNV